MEVLVNILKHLPMQDVKESSLVSRRWARASAPHIFTRIAIVHNVGQRIDNLGCLEPLPPFMVHMHELRLWIMGKGGLDVRALVAFIANHPNLHSLELFALEFHHTAPDMSPGQDVFTSRKLRKLDITGATSMDAHKLVQLFQTFPDVDTLVLSTSMLTFMSEDPSVKFVHGKLRVRALKLKLHVGKKQHWEKFARAIQLLHHMLDHDVLEFVDDSETGLWVLYSQARPYPNLRRLRTGWLYTTTSGRILPLSERYPALERVDLGRTCKPSRPGLWASTMEMLQNAPDTLQQFAFEIHPGTPSVPTTWNPPPAVSVASSATSPTLEQKLTTRLGDPAWLDIGDLIERLPNFQRADIELVLETSRDLKDEDNVRIKNALLCLLPQWVSHDTGTQERVHFTIRWHERRVQSCIHLC